MGCERQQAASHEYEHQHPPHQWPGGSMRGVLMAWHTHASGHAPLPPATHSTAQGTHHTGPESPGNPAGASGAPPPPGYHEHSQVQNSAARPPPPPPLPCSNNTALWGVGPPIPAAQQPPWATAPQPGAPPPPACTQTPPPRAWPRSWQPHGGAVCTRSCRAWCSPSGGARGRGGVRVGG